MSAVQLMGCDRSRERAFAPCCPNRYRRTRTNYREIGVSYGWRRNLEVKILSRKHVSFSFEDHKTSRFFFPMSQAILYKWYLKIPTASDGEEKLRVTWWGLAAKADRVFSKLGLVIISLNLIWVSHSNSHSVTNRYIIVVAKITNRVYTVTISKVTPPASVPNKRSKSDWNAGHSIGWAWLHQSPYLQIAGSRK